MSEPCVTVVVPLHNHQDWICDALDSVAKQDYVNKRVIVVDDGSTDISAEMVLNVLTEVKEPMTQSQPWVCMGKYEGMDLMLCRFNDARGPSFARNYGIKAASQGTDLYAFLDSDDIYLPSKLTKSVEQWKLAPEHVGGVYSDYETFNSQTGIRVREYKEPFSRERLVRECIVNMDSLVSKEALTRCGVFDETLRVAEDYDLWLRISEKFVLVHIPECLVSIRVGSHSSTATVSKDVWQKSWHTVMEKAKTRMQNVQ